MAGSRESTQLNPKHRQVNPSFSARLRAFVISHKASMSHEPAKRALDNPPARQYRKPWSIQSADDFHFKLGPTILHPLLKILSCIAAINPNLSHLGEPSCNPLENLLSPVSLGQLAGVTTTPQQQSQGIHQNVPLAPVDLFTGIKADLAPWPSAFDALTVQDGGGGLGPALLIGTNAGCAARH